MKCDYCDHEWISVSPIEAKSLECPECGKMSCVSETARALEMALRENRVHVECLVECLEIAVEALYWYGHNCPVLLCSKAGKALTQIEARLAELESGEDTGG